MPAEHDHERVARQYAALRQLLDEYLAEYDTPAPDALYRASLRERLRTAVRLPEPLPDSRPEPDLYPLLFKVEVDESDTAVQFYLRGRPDGGYVDLLDAGAGGLTARTNRDRIPIAVLANSTDVLVQTASALGALAAAVRQRADVALNADLERIPSR